MKLEEGMYVRTTYGIGKIVNIFFEKTGTFIETDNGLGDCTMATRGKLHKGIYIFEEDYKTFIDTNVKNTIIELIEKGDYVNGEKVIRIYEKGECYDGSNYGLITKTIETENDNYETIPHNHLYVGYSIKSIVTKEQFESMQYKVGE